MENRNRSLFLLSAALLASSFCLSASALAAEPAADPAATPPGEETFPPEYEQVINPELDRRQIDIADIDTENFEIGIFGGVMNVEDFGTNPVYGVRVAYHFSEDLFFELTAGQTDTDLTSFERLSGNARILLDSERRLTYYNVSVGYNLLPGEAFLGSKRAYNTALYLIGGIGSTDFAGDNRFTFNIGAGYRFLLTDWLTLHIDVRDHIFDIDLLGEDKTTNNLEAHTGFTIFF